MKNIIWLTIIVLQYSSGQKYYPSSIGNEWYFDSSSTAFNIKVKSDSTFANGKIYAVLNRNDFAHGQYIRVDSLYVYHYYPDEAKEYPVFKLTGKVGDTTQTKYYRITIKSIDTTLIFNQSSRNIHYRLEDITQRDIVLSDKFGLVCAELYSDPPPPWPDYIYQLVGCKIDGNKYGYTLSVREQLINPIDFTLFQNYPNPFNPSTTISFSLTEASFVQLSIFDLLGRIVATLVSENIDVGYHSAVWNAEHISSGVYYYKITVGSKSESKKLVLIR